MSFPNDYPKYLTYESRKQKPSVVFQEYPLPLLAEGEKYYPDNTLLLNYFTSEKEKQKFSASQFCSFLGDTIEVEHCLVIPAIASLRRIPFNIPSKPKQDLYKTATDEGHHAEQAVIYLTELENHFGVPKPAGSPLPLFMRRLEDQRSMETDPVYKELIKVLNGIVTETRISVELSQFAANEDLSDSVRKICLSHAKDEAIHSSQFQALGRWLWDAFDKSTKEKASKTFINSIIARSLPDLDSIIYSFMKSTGRSFQDATQIVLNVYNEDVLIEEMSFAAKPTLLYMSKLGVNDYSSFDLEIEMERQKIYFELSAKRGNLNSPYMQ